MTNFRDVVSRLIAEPRMDTIVLHLHDFAGDRPINSHRMNYCVTLDSFL